MIGGVSAFNGSLGYLLGQEEGDKAFCLDACIYEASMCLTELLSINAYNDNPLPTRMGINRFPPTIRWASGPAKMAGLALRASVPGNGSPFVNC